MKKSEIAISFGSSETVIFLKGAGIVLREATLAMRQNNGAWVYGNLANKHLSKKGSVVTFVNPVMGGAIKDEEVAVNFLKYCLNKIISRGIFEPSIKAIFLVPCGLNLIDRSTFKNVAYKSGITEVVFVPNVIAIKFGYGLPAFNRDTFVICDVGGGKTDIGVVSSTQLLGGITLGIGGKAMDFAISNYIERSYQLKVSDRTSEEIKKEVGSLHPSDKGSIEVTGFDVETHIPRAEVIYASDVKNSVEDFYSEIIKQIDNVIKSISIDISNDLLKNGILLAGGGCNISGLDKLIKTKLGLKVSLCEDAENVNMLGAKQILASSELEKKIIMDN